MNRIYRLRKRKDFNYIYKKGKSVANQYLVLVYRRSSFYVTRVGFSVSKKFGNSVKRNRIKRQLKEIYRKRIPYVKEGFDLIFVVRKNARDVEFSKLEEAVDNLLRRAGVFREME